MKVFIVLAVFVAAAVAQIAEQYAPIPYSFNYVADTEDGGRSSRTESGDGAGRVEGAYTVDDLEGNSRRVEYIADEAGFRAVVRTNEPGTAPINPADVTMESTAGAGAVSYSLGAGAPAPAARPAVAPATAGGRGRFVLVPVTDPRARGYY